MYLARILYPVRTLGPGQRIGIWVQGCSLHCPDCANPELWMRTPDTAISVSHVAEAIRAVAEKQQVDGLTISGGEPFEQADALLELLNLVRDTICDVLVYTGRTREQLMEELSADQWAQVKRLIDVLIDGPYRRELNDNQAALRGSTNQRILYLNQAREPVYTAYLAQGRSVQNIFYGSSLLSIGIHQKEEPQ